MAQGKEKVVNETDDAQERIDAMNDELDSVLTDEPEEQKSVATRHTEVASHGEQMRPDDLLRIAVERGISDVEQLEKLIDLRNREIARQAKDKFEVEFARLQSQIGEVKRTKEATDADGKRLYAYAPLEDIVAVVGPTIAEFGFSYKFEESRIEGSDEKRVSCVVRGFGHEERTSIDVPIPPTSKLQNSVQVRGSASSYGRRYAFMAAFGITINDEDDDAQTFTMAEIQDLLPGMAEMEAATTMEELKASYKKAFKSAVSESQKMLVVATKNRIKGALSGAGNG